MSYFANPYNQLCIEAKFPFRFREYTVQFFQGALYQLDRSWIKIVLEEAFLSQRQCRGTAQYLTAANCVFLCWASSYSHASWCNLDWGQVNESRSSPNLITRDNQEWVGILLPPGVGICHDWSCNVLVPFCQAPRQMGVGLLVLHLSRYYFGSKDATRWKTNPCSSCRPFGWHLSLFKQWLLVMITHDYWPPVGSNSDPPSGHYFSLDFFLFSTWFKWNSLHPCKDWSRPYIRWQQVLEMLLRGAEGLQTDQANSHRETIDLQTRVKHRIHLIWLMVSVIVCDKLIRQTRLPQWIPSCWPMSWELLLGIPMWLYLCIAIPKDLTLA